MPLPPHPLASLDQICESPSRRDGVCEELEMDLRAVGCQLIQELGILVELPQSTLATAQVLLHRFYYVSSMLSFSINDVSLASLYLSSKLCETPIRLRDLLNVYVLLLTRIQHVQQTASNTPPSSLQSLLESGRSFPEFKYTAPPFQSNLFYELKNSLIVTEIQILKRLGFNLQCDLAYSHLVNYCKILDLVNKDGVIQLCWGILNDALQTPIYTHHPPPTVACFSILLATRLLHIPLPAEWWILFDADWEDMWACCGSVMRLWEMWGTGPVDVGIVGGVVPGVGSIGSAQNGAGSGTAMTPIEVDPATAPNAAESSPGRALRITDSQERRWRRAWKLMLGKKYVRRWLEEELAGLSKTL